MKINVYFFAPSRYDALTQTCSMDKIHAFQYRPGDELIGKIKLTFDDQNPSLVMTHWSAYNAQNLCGALGAVPFEAQSWKDLIQVKAIMGGAGYTGTDWLPMDGHLKFIMFGHSWVAKLY